MLWFQLAWRFGCPVSELQERMSFAEYLEWQEYLREVPGGDDIANWRDAQIASAIYRTTCAKKPDDFPVKDFLPRYETPGEPQARPGEVTDWRQMKAMIALGTVGLHKPVKP